MSSAVLSWIFFIQFYNLSDVPYIKLIYCVPDVHSKHLGFYVTWSVAFDIQIGKSAVHRKSRREELNVVKRLKLYRNFMDK